MVENLMIAATAGDAETMRGMDTSVLSKRTPAGNTCLHIASIHGHQRFCQAVLDRNHSLLVAINDDGETPLLVAVTNGHISLASFFLDRYRNENDHQLREREALTLRETLSKKDKHGCNALHHAIRNGHRELALKLIAVAKAEEVAAAPALSGAVNKYGESPIFIAVMRDYEDIFDALLNIPGSAHAGAGGYNALHAAVRNVNSGERT